jgi:hypothetical protein
LTPGTSSIQPIHQSPRCFTIAVKLLFISQRLRAVCHLASRLSHSGCRFVLWKGWQAAPGHCAERQGRALMSAWGIAPGIQIAFQQRRKLSAVSNRRILLNPNEPVSGGESRFQRWRFLWVCLRSLGRCPRLAVNTALLALNTSCAATRAGERP